MWLWGKGNRCFEIEQTSQGMKSLLVPFLQKLSHGKILYGIWPNILYQREVEDVMTLLT